MVGAGVEGFNRAEAQGGELPPLGPGGVISGKGSGLMSLFWFAIGVFAIIMSISCSLFTHTLFSLSSLHLCCRSVL